MQNLQHKEQKMGSLSETDFSKIMIEAKVPHSKVNRSSFDKMTHLQRSQLMKTFRESQGGLISDPDSFMEA